jgi:hypothetical protein
MVKNFPKAIDQTKNVTLNGNLVCQTLFQGKQKNHHSPHDIVEEFNTKQPSFGMGPPQLVLPRLIMMPEVVVLARARQSGLM